jgi:small-conductance mechanosensitive channel
MSDTSTTGTPTEQTNPLDVGTSTSEFHLSAVAAVLGIVATIVGYVATILDVLPQDLKWVGVASAIVGIISTCLTALGYTVTRGAVKKAALRAGQTTVTVLPAEDAAAKVFKPS